MAVAHPAKVAANSPPAPTGQPQKLYFPGLNGLRAVAASLVVLGHYDQVAKRYGLPTMVDNEEITLGFSINAVGIFFVLSGFLLTYLLMAEKAKHGRIALGKFYMRRILRIWPLYYIILLIGFGLFPFLEFAHAPGYIIGLEKDGIGTLLLYIFMLPHVVFAYINNEIVVVSVLWSIGVEETFYLFWPILLALFRRHLLPILGVLVFFALLIPVGGYVLFHVFGPNPSVLVARTQGFLHMITFDAMAIGGLAAYIVYQHATTGRFARVLQVITHPATAVLAIIGVVLFWGGYVQFKYFNKTVVSVFYAIVILNACRGRWRLLPLENRVMNLLGKVSYGIYVYHCVVLFILLGLLDTWGMIPAGSIIASIALLGLVYALTILVSWLSFEYIEMRFLRLKDRYVRIESSNTKP